MGKNNTRHWFPLETLLMMMIFEKGPKIEGIKEIWPVVEIPVTIKIEDYTETATFLGIDLNAFGEIQSRMI